MFKLVLFTDNVKKMVAEKYCEYQKALSRKYGKFKTGKSTETNQYILKSLHLQVVGSAPL